MEEKSQCFHLQLSVSPDKYPVPHILVVFDVFLHLPNQPGEGAHNLRQVLYISARCENEHDFSAVTEMDKPYHTLTSECNVKVLVFTLVIG